MGICSGRSLCRFSLRASALSACCVEICAWLLLAGCAIELPFGVFGCQRDDQCPPEQVCGPDQRCQEPGFALDGGAGKSTVVLPGSGSGGGGAGADAGGEGGTSEGDAGSCPSSCEGATPACWAGSCVECRPGARVCEDNSVKVCGDDGAWGAADSCSGERAFCNEGACFAVRVVGHVAGSRVVSDGEIRLSAHGFDRSAPACGSVGDQRVCVRGGIAP